MEFLEYLVDIFLNLDKYILILVTDYRAWTYLILFLIIFAETGLIVTPFLPGDSLIFAAGAIAATGALNIWLLMLLLFVAAILGDTVNYSIGKYIGVKAFKKDYRFLKKEYLFKAQAFYEKHGGKTIVIARFIPIIRTFAPFVAGVGTMNYRRFLFYNISGGLFWVVSCSMAGYFFGNLSFVKNNFSLVILAIIFIPLLPIFVKHLKYRLNKKKA